MAKLNRETILHIAQLSRIRLTKEDETRLLKELTDILSYVEQLDEIDTADTPPCYQVVANHEGFDVEDETGATLEREIFLNNAPAHLGGMIQVPPVIGSDGSNP